MRKPQKVKKVRQVKAAPSAPTLARLIAQMQEYKHPKYIRTGIHAIDMILYDGIPCGRYIECLGDPSTTKSAFCYSAIAAFQRAGGMALLIDPESKTDQSFAEKMGVNFKTLGYSVGEALESVIKLLGRIAQTADPDVPTLVVLDSLAATPLVEELDEEFDAGKPEMAKRARVISASFRAILGQLHRKNVAFIGVNQLRMNIGGTFAFKDSPGGRAPKYHASARLMFKKENLISSPTTGVVSGILVEVEAIKNALGPPFRHATLRFKFDTGFDPYSGLKELLIRHGRLTVEEGSPMMKFGDYAFKDHEWERVVLEHPEILRPIKNVMDVQGRDEVRN